MVRRVLLKLMVIQHVLDMKIIRTVIVVLLLMLLHQALYTVILTQYNRQH